MLKRGFCKNNDKFNIVLGEPPFLPDVKPAPAGPGEKSGNISEEQGEAFSDSASQIDQVDSPLTNPGVEISQIEVEAEPLPELESNRISILLNPANPESYNQFISKCSEALKARDVPMMHVSRAEIILRELIAISAGRGSNELPDKLVEVSCTIAPDKVVINVVDSSSGFDSVVSLSQIKESIGSKVRESGLGFHHGSINDDISFIDGGHCAQAILSLKIN